MKLTITREDLRQFVLKETNIDILNAPIDIDIEGYLKDEDYAAKEILADVAGGSVNESTSKLVKKLIWPDDDRKIITDKEGRVLDIVKEEREPKKAEIKNKWRSNLNNHPDYTDYESTVLDFATSTEHKRQVPFFGAGTIACCKARYQKMIDKLGISDSVKFSRINNLPYLVKIEGEKSMGDILNEGINK